MASARAMTDHDEIRQWAEERGAQPSCVKGTGGRRGKGDVGMIRLDLPGFSGEGSLQKVSWNEWFRQFDDNNLALMVQDKTARGQSSNFNKLVSRDSAQSRSTGRGGRTRRAGSAKRTSGGTGRQRATETRSSRGTASTRTRTRSASTRAASRKQTARTRTAGAARGRKTTATKRASRKKTARQ
jgi:hypothetical protein